MKIPLIAVILLLAACSPKKYTKPEIGMDRASFTILCMPINGSVDDVHLVKTAQDETVTVTYKPAETRSDTCAGTFTFVNSKLTSIAY